jgi:hypothetical protein
MSFGHAVHPSLHVTTLRGAPWRTGLALAACLASSTIAPPVAAVSPSPEAPSVTSPSQPSPGTEISPGGLPWSPVSLDLPNGHWLTDLTAWKGGFAALESDDEDVLSALWTSPDGTTWVGAPLPNGVENGRLVALADHLYLQEFRGRGDSQELRIRTWRTADGRDWQRQGLFEWSLPAPAGDEWRIISRFVVAAPDRLVMFGEVEPCCGSGGSLPIGTRFASILAVASSERVPLGGVVIWTSPDGAEWTQRANQGLLDSDDDDTRIETVEGVANGVLATRVATNDALISSPDGSAWTSLGPMPPGYGGKGPTGLVIAQDRVVISFDAGEHTNTLEVWVQDDDGGWTRSLQESKTTAGELVASGSLVVAAGQSYDDGAEGWPRILVSTDGGSTWDPDLSWSGARGGCIRDLATDGARLVLLGCDEGSPTLWHSDVPEPAFEGRQTRGLGLGLEP